jgi:hypothetical protein
MTINTKQKLVRYLIYYILIIPIGYIVIPVANTMTPKGVIGFILYCTFCFFISEKWASFIKFKK